MSGEIPELGRFAEPSLYILLSLSDGPKHGYAIMTDVEAISGSPLGPGTLYAALARLEARGLIEALEPAGPTAALPTDGRRGDHVARPARADARVRADRPGAARGDTGDDQPHAALSARLARAVRGRVPLAPRRASAGRPRPARHRPRGDRCPGPAAGPARDGRPDPGSASCVRAVASARGARPARRRPLARRAGGLRSNGPIVVDGYGYLPRWRGRRPDRAGRPSSCSAPG